MNNFIGLNVDYNALSQKAYKEIEEQFKQIKQCQVPDKK